jgi:hypothetical protein
MVPGETSLRVNYHDHEYWQNKSLSPASVLRVMARLHHLLLLLLCFSAQRVLAEGAICALVAEGTAAPHACPAGEVITGITSAVFGTFSPGSSCAAGLTPAPACPTTVISQVGRLCTGAAACNVSCDCATLPSPCGCVSAAPSLAGVAQRLALALGNALHCWTVLLQYCRHARHLRPLRKRVRGIAYRISLAT